MEMTLVKSLHKVIVCSSREQCCRSATIARKKWKMIKFMLSRAFWQPGELAAWTTFVKVQEYPRSDLQDKHPGSSFRELSNNFGLKYLYSCGSEIRFFFNPGSGIEKSVTGIWDGKIWIRAKHPGSATLKNL
jgi:hypothetical protein